MNIDALICGEANGFFYFNTQELSYLWLVYSTIWVPLQSGGVAHGVEFGAGAAFARRTVFKYGHIVGVSFIKMILSATFVLQGVILENGVGRAVRPGNELGTWKSDPKESEGRP